jgi:glycosyltransferase involved in cell wall biosynthesis
MSAKKVLMFGWEYPPLHSGGLGVACKGMAHALIDNEVHVCFVLPKTAAINDPKVSLKFADKNLEKVTTTTKLEILARELQNPYLTSVEYEKQLKLFIKAGGKIVPRTMVEQVDYYAALVHTFSKEELESYDVIHAHDWLCYPAGLAAKKITGKPLVVHVHATEFDRCGGNNVNQQVYDRERQGMHEADHVITVSEFTKKIVVEKYGVHPDKITVVHNGNTPAADVRSRRFAPLQAIKDSGKKIVLYAGRVTIQKGVDYFIQSAKRVIEHNNDVYFIVAGTGDMEQQMKSLVQDLGMSNYFLFTGYYTLEDLPDLFSLADVMVIPSVSEPFGIIPLESLSYKTPLILSKQSGAAEVISHALKVDFWDTDKMANNILAVIQNPSLKETLQWEGWKQVQGITWDKAAKKMKALYQTIT